MNTRRVMVVTDAREEIERMMLRLGPGPHFDWGHMPVWNWCVEQHRQLSDEWMSLLVTGVAA